MKTRNNKQGRFFDDDPSYTVGYDTAAHRQSPIVSFFWIGLGQHNKHILAELSRFEQIISVSCIKTVLQP